MLMPLVLRTLLLPLCCADSTPAAAWPPHASPAA